MRYVAAIVVIVVVAAGVFAGVQLTRSVPSPSFEPKLASATALPGSAPSLPWPSIGSGAVSVKGLGLVGQFGTTTPQAIASIAKVMTALIVLTDHPLSQGENGPSITFDASDVATYNADVADSQSVIKVVAGESLTELQALEALLIPSANNVAIKLAQWDAGSTASFVAKMNATASRLGMTSSHFTDPSGLTATTVSTAPDLLKLAAAAMANSAFASIVDMPQVTLPYNGTVYNYDYDLGHDGIVGIKTGSDSAAGGCFLFDSNDSVDGRQVQIIGVVLGQQTVSPITAALDAAEKLVPATLRVLHTYTAVPSGLVVGQIAAPWSKSVTVTTTAALTVFGWPGERLGLSLNRISRLPATVTAGEKLGTLLLETPGRTESTTVEATGSITGPSFSWRLER